MTVDPHPPPPARVAAEGGTLGNLSPDEEKKLQQAWIHLLRLCGVEDYDPAEKASFPEVVPDITSELRQQYQHAASAPGGAGGAGGDDDNKKNSPEDFRQGLWGFILSEHPDALVLRFLRARKWDVGRAMGMLVSAVGWRQRRDLAGTVIRRGEGVALSGSSSSSSSSPPSVDDAGFMSQYRSGKSYVHATDAEGRLVYIIRVRLHDPRLQSGDAMESYILHNIESLRILIKPPHDKCCLLFDMTGFGVKNMDFHVVKFLVSVFEARYPETLGVVLIHNAPFVFWGIWNMIKGWLDPVIASKINFTRKPADLLRFIPAENLQVMYGGRDEWEYSYVEPVEGENYRLDAGADEERDAIQRERDELIREFEGVTMAWDALAGGSSVGMERATKRTEVADRLTENYWRLDPYIRARTLHHRVGMAGEGD